MSSQEYRPATQTTDEQPDEATENRAPDAQDLVGNAEVANCSFVDKAMASVFGGKAEPLKRMDLEPLHAAVDREAASIELNEKFNVVDDPSQLDGNPNTVTKEDFDHMVGLYSDIRRGKTDLQLDTAGMDPEAAAAFKGKTMEDIGTMMQTESGRLLLDGLAHNENGHKTSISGIDDPSKSVCGRKYGDDPEEQQKLYNQDHDGTGNDASVKYAPGKDTTETGPDGYALPERSDSILFHELTHAYHRTTGTMTPGTVSDPTNGCDQGIDREEYATVGIGKDGTGRILSEDQYRSERYMMGEDDMVPRTRYSPDGKQTGLAKPDHCVDN